MTREQYDRWKDFALRMVNIVIGPRKRKPSRSEVRENIEFLFECRIDPGESWKRIRNWDHTDPTEEEKARWPRFAMCVGSHVSDCAEYFVPDYWSMPDTERAHEKAEERFVNPVHICVRAGLDLAVAESAGVLGYTAGDLRRMYPEGVPDWVKGEPTWETVGIKAIVPGVGFVPEPKGDAKSFDELPDDAEVWI